MSCLEVAAATDAVLLIADAVNEAVDTLERPVFALQEDITARQLDDRIAANVTLIDYPGFVELAASHQIGRAHV